MAEALRVLAVTGTDTGVGKTVVTAALAARAHALGIRVAAMKPIESGIGSRAASVMTPGVSLPWSDGARLARAAGAGDAIELVCPISLPEPLAPMVAAERAGTTIDFDFLDRARETLATNRELLLVEGAGGIMSPITKAASFGDLFKRWGADLLIVAGNKLGVLNHTLLTVQHAQSLGLNVRAVVLTSLSDRDSDLAEATNYDALVALLPHCRIHRFAWIDRVDDLDALAGAAQLAGLDRLLLPPEA